jgi:divalent metal cation (Fe/Co/Zn/Cd) transporter
MGDMILVDVHIEVDGDATVRVGHDIAFEAAQKVTSQMPVLNVMTHIDPI